jgi:anthranilate phosphoribosyltransferase
MLKEAIYKVVTRQDLTEAEMVAAMEAIMEGQATEAQIGAFITGLRMKGETVAEITAAAKVMRAKATRIPMGNGLIDLDRDEINVDWETIVDTCGTGGRRHPDLQRLHHHRVCGGGRGAQGGQARQPGRVLPVWVRRRHRGPGD